MQLGFVRSHEHAFISLLSIIYCNVIILSIKLIYKAILDSYYCNVIIYAFISLISIIFGFLILVSYPHYYSLILLLSIKFYQSTENRTKY